MPASVKVIDRNRILGGYSLSVRDSWVYKIKKVHINEYEKEKYLEDFGEKIITFDEFFEWYKKIKEVQKKENAASEE